eukprot:GABV01010308.1.p1 GENE.GABV01010308.1~~GABV01010308.1.p1  ORF type:complete len:160 (-),score=78.77 GABV01010308.1:17-430(-)
MEDDDLPAWVESSTLILLQLAERYRALVAVIHENDQNQILQQKIPLAWLDDPATLIDPLFTPPAAAGPGGSGRDDAWVQRDDRITPRGENQEDGEVAEEEEDDDDEDDEGDHAVTGGSSSSPTTPGAAGQLETDQKK